MAYAEIESFAELRDLLGAPSGRAVTKVTKEQEILETLEELEEHYATANYSRLLY